MNEYSQLTGVEVQTGMYNIIHSEPLTLTERIGDDEGFVHIRQVTTTTATDVSKILQNVADSVNYKLPKFREHEEFQKVKLNTQKIAIVGGGPSLKDNLEELKSFDVILVAGSPHDYLLKNGIVPTYCAICDPDPIAADYLQEADQDSTVEYLIASGCDKAVFERLQLNECYVWHCYGDALKEKFREIDPGCDMVGGGCTIGLRCINIAILLGYTNIHLFGFDSCNSSTNEHHAYDFVNEEESAGMGTEYVIKIGQKGLKKYKVVGYQLAQAEHFTEFFRSFYNLVTFTFHGDGLLKDVHEHLKADIQSQQREATL